MKRLFSNTGLWLLAAVATIAVVLCVLSALSSGTPFLSNAVGVISAPFRRAGSAVSSWVQDTSHRFSSVTELEEENQALRRQIADLEAELRRTQRAAEENENLRQLLDLRQERRDLSFESVHITERPVSNWSSTFVLDKGSRFDVAIGDTVVDTQGSLVGVITDVGSNWSRMTSLLDSDCQIGAKVFRTGDLAITGGDLALMLDQQLKLSNLSEDARLLHGDLVVTSGLGGYYPSDLVIGTVDQILTDDSGLAQYATLVPHADLSSLSQLFIITDFDIVD